MDAPSLTRALGGRWHGAYGLASCPVPGHGRGLGDRHPSLSISRGTRQALVVHCHAGRSQGEVIEGLKALDLWPSTCATFKSACIKPAPMGPDPRIQTAQALWMQGSPIEGTPAALYLCSRALPWEAEALRYLPAAGCREIPAAAEGAMMAALSSASGDVRAVQLTFLTGHGRKAGVSPARKTYGIMAGTGVQLAPARDTLGLAEGVETALSASLIFGVPVWAACGRRLSDVPIPPRVRKVILFADHDMPGCEAAEAAAATFSAKELDVSIKVPELRGQDWNDVLVSLGKATG